MIRAVIKSMNAVGQLSWSDFAAYESPDPFDDFGWFHVTVGATDTEGGNDFQVCVATPRAVARARHSGATPGILVDRFDADSVHAAIHDRVGAITGHSWGQIVDQLRSFMRWEYEGMAGA